MTFSNPIASPACGQRAGKPNCFVCWKAMALLCLAILCGPAYSALSCRAPSIGTFSFTLPSGNYAIPRDTPVGTRITPFTSFQTGYPNVWSCSETTANMVHGPVYQGLLASSGMTYSEGGETYQVFQTNLAGVGLIMKIGSYIPGGWYDSHGLSSRAYESAGAWANSVPTSGQLFGAGMAFAFVKTGPMTAGTVSLAGSIAQIGMTERPIGAPVRILPVVVTGNPTFSVLACTTPNVTVNLGSHKSSEFSGLNTFTSSVSFNLALNNCPAGMNTVRYRVDAVTAIVNAANSVVALDSSSTATGVGVQLLDGSGSPFPLGTAKLFSGYSGSSGGSYTIPFRARYYQTGSTIGPGKANTVMTFTMTYL